MNRLPHITVVVASLFVLACAPSYVIVPASGKDTATAHANGFAMRAVPNAWNDDPSDLASYVTPIWIQLVNRSTHDVRVVYADLALTNGDKFRYAVISPFPNPGYVPQGKPAATKPPPAPPAKPKPQGEDGPGAARDWDGAATNAADRRTDYYFDKADGSEGEPQLAALGDGTGAVELARHGRIGGGFGHGHTHFGVGFYGYPHLHSHFGYYPGWPYYWGYGSMYYWAPRYYRVGPTEAMIRRALPEGVLHAGGHVSGFVYFQHAATAPGGLDLGWTVHRTDGTRLTDLQVRLVVVED